MTDSIVIIPTFNEVDNIACLLRAVFSLEKRFDVLVVDDNSPDGTAQKVRDLQKCFPDRLFLKIRRQKMGLGTAYIKGFRWALAQHYEFIYEMDADFSHNPNDLPRLYETCTKGADIAVGSRYKKGVNIVNWPLSRMLLSYGASFYVKLITCMKVHDPTSGFICYRRKVLENIDLDTIQSTGYAFQIEMKFKAHCQYFKIEEVSIIFTDRIHGKSKMNLAIVLEAIFGVISIKIKSIKTRKA